MTSPRMKKLALGLVQIRTFKIQLADKMLELDDVYLNPEGLNEGWVDKKQNIYCKDGILVVVKNGVVDDGTRIGIDV